jgi:hypothetical protein
MQRNLKAVSTFGRESSLKILFFTIACSIVKRKDNLVEYKMVSNALPTLQTMVSIKKENTFFNHSMIQCCKQK